MRGACPCPDRRRPLPAGVARRTILKQMARDVSRAAKSWSVQDSERLREVVEVAVSRIARSGLGDAAAQDVQADHARGQRPGAVDAEPVVIRISDDDHHDCRHDREPELAGHEGAASLGRREQPRVGGSRSRCCSSPDVAGWSRDSCLPCQPLPGGRVHCGVSARPPYPRPVASHRFCRKTAEVLQRSCSGCRPMNVTTAEPVQLVCGNTELVQWSVHISDNEVTVMILGEVDISSEPALGEALEKVVAMLPTRIVVDLAGVSYLDSSGVRCLLNAAKRVAGAGGELVVCRPVGIVLRVLEICGVDDLLLHGDAATERKISSIVTVSERSIYSIGALARMLGVSPTTLRSWEDRYGVVVPERSAGSQRLYSRDDLDQLRFVCRADAARA